jgi:chromosome segregation ATPase
MNNEINTDIEFDRNNLDIDNTQAAFVQTLNLQINQLQKLLEEKNKEFDNINNENNKLKLLLIQEQKKIIEKDNMIYSLNSNKKSLEDKINKYKINEENLQNKIKELNYQIIELNQNMISKENMNQFNNKIKNIIEDENHNKENNNNENNFAINEKIGVELTKLNNSIDELEIKNNKLVFENKTLNNKISTLISDKNNDINTYKSIYQTQINNLNKIISYLNSRISESFSDKSMIKTNNKTNNLISNEIIEKFNILENKLNSYDKENSELRKENQNIKNELDELKLVTKSKEKIIEKLQNDFGIMENEYRNNLPNNLNQMGIIKNEEINSAEYVQYINELTNKQNTLENENNNLRNGLKQMAKNINEANDIYFKRKAQYDNNIKIRDNKLREYKNKISILKMKINELHQEIRILKNNKVANYNQASFLSQNNNDMNNNQLKNEQMNLISHTPKIKKKEIPFELNLERKEKLNEINENNKDIFGDIKISEVPRITETQQQNNSDINPQDMKNIQEYKDLLNKVDEQLQKYN